MPKNKTLITAQDHIKQSNPKDSIGVLKVSWSYLPFAPLNEAAFAMMEGGFKYGKHNYRKIGVRASVYVDAAQRHLTAFQEGEDYDPEITDKDGNCLNISHITKIITSMLVLRDAMILGIWIDDRPPRTINLIPELNAKIKLLAQRYPDPVPPYTEKPLMLERDRVANSK